jgi:hypothetical protein
MCTAINHQVWPLECLGNHERPQKTCLQHLHCGIHSVAKTAVLEVVLNDPRMEEIESELLPNHSLIHKPQNDIENQSVLSPRRNRPMQPPEKQVERLVENCPINIEDVRDQSRERQSERIEDEARYRQGRCRRRQLCCRATECELLGLLEVCLWIRHCELVLAERCMGGPHNIPSGQPIMLKRFALMPEIDCTAGLLKDGAVPAKHDGRSA